MGLKAESLDYALALNGWTLCRLPFKYTQEARLRGYYVNIPKAEVLDWLANHCEGDYKMNVFLNEPIIYFKDDAIAMHFKLVWCYE
jgi:hypothetical protein